MEDKFKAQGFEVLGFYSNDFGNQGGDPGSCMNTYKTTYDQFDVAHVVGASAEPVFKWIESQPNPGPEPNLAPSWNFNKYLIARDGTLVGHWESQVYPGDDPNNTTDSFDTSAIVVAIKSELAKPAP